MRNLTSTKDIGKGNFLILRRYRAGDLDIMLKTYGQCGIVRVFVPEGVLPEKGLLGYVEPFNLLSIVYQQSGDILILKDLLHVDFLSYLCLKNYSTYLWISSLVSFMEKWFIHYDPELFKMAIKYLTLKPKNHEVLLTKFKVEFLKAMGLYKEDLFREDIAKILRFIAEEENLLKLERLRINKNKLMELEKAIEDHLSNSL